jgi:hypothetical protein
VVETTTLPPLHHALLEHAAQRLANRETAGVEFVARLAFSRQPHVDRVQARLHPLAQRIEDLGVARRVRRHVAKPCAIMYGNQPTPASLF